MVQVKGVIPAVITPFDSEGEINETALRGHLEFLVKSVVHGLFIGGSYGSGPLLSAQQRMRLVEICVEQVEHRIPVVAHIGAPDTRTTVLLAKHAEKAGVGAVACVEPYYYIHDADTVTRHYLEIINGVSTPVYLYNNPRYSNFNVSTEQLVYLAEHGLAGVKDSSHNITLFYDYVASVPKDGFTFLIGSQTLLLPAMVVGAHGCISGLSNAFPGLIIEIYDACCRGNYDEAARLQKKANSLRKLTGSGIPIPFYHAVLPMVGIDLGLPKAPFQQLSEERRQSIYKQLKEMGMVE